MDEQERGLDFGGFGGSARQVVLVLGLIFVVALAVVVGRRMSAGALAVVVGVVCGVAASIPASLLLLVALTRRDRDGAGPAGRRGRQRDYPPVVVIQGGGSPAGLPPTPQAGYWPSPMPGPTADRQWQVVGDDLLLEDDRY